MNAQIQRLVFPSLSLAAALLATLPGCTQVLGEQPTLNFSFGVHVQSDDGRPVAGAEIASSTGTVVTDADGHAELALSGHEGDRLPHTVTCPKEYNSPANPLFISLRRGFENGSRPVYDATCVPAKRTVVVGVKLDDGPDLPIMYLGQQVARTDASGAAHVLLHVEADEPFRLTIDTNEPGRENVRPQNPSTDLAVGQADDILIFEQKMSLFVPKVIVKKKAVRVGPKRI
jgi:hypothetical protein